MFIVLFSGCLGSDDTDFDTNLNAPDSVSIEFIPGNPPDQIYEGTPFSLALKIENEGNDKINSGDMWVHVIGVDPNSIKEFSNYDCNSFSINAGSGLIPFKDYSFSFSRYNEGTGELLVNYIKESDTNTKTISLGEEFMLEEDFYLTVNNVAPDGTIEGTACNGPSSEATDVTAVNFFSKEITTSLIPSVEVDGKKIPGGITQVSWDALKYKENISSDQQLDFLAKACYIYSSKATGRACFNINPYSQVTGTQTCTVNGEKEVGNEIGPIKITKMNEYYTGKNEGKQRYTFTLTIENIDDGDVFLRSADLENCMDLKQNELNRVEVTKFKIGTIDYIANGQCENNEVYLTNGVGEWNCMISKDPITGYDLVNIEIEYGYTQQTRKTLTLKNSFEDAELY